MIRNIGELTAKYELKEILGQGIFGAVKKAIVKGTRDKKAIKTLRKECIVAQTGGMEQLIQEINVLR